MDEQTILKNLCYYDPRSPYYETPEEGEEAKQPRKTCFCDNCFYGRDELAMEILRLSELQGRTSHE